VLWLTGHGLAVSSQRVPVSVLVVGAIRQGIARLERRDPVRSARLDEWLSRLHC
jgi:hypothetical protein